MPLWVDMGPEILTSHELSELDTLPTRPTPRKVSLPTRTCEEPHAACKPQCRKRVNRHSLAALELDAHRAPSQRVGSVMMYSK